MYWPHLTGIFYLILLTGCSSGTFVASKVKTYNYSIAAEKKGESADMTKMLTPYADSVHRNMDIEIGRLDVQLTKSWPECSLGNFMADTYRIEGSKKFRKNIDVAFMNYGGIRLNSLEAGMVTKGKIFELMPFDNLLVLIDIKGTTLQELLNQSASGGGWPISGATYSISKTKATNIQIGTEPLDLEKTYTIATSDYFANNGVENNVLKDLTQINIGYLQRDAILDYILSFGRLNKPIVTFTGIRVSKAS